MHGIGRISFLLRKRNGISIQNSIAAARKKELEKKLKNRRLKLQIADGQEDSTKLKAMVKHWSQQMSAGINREASRNIIRKASQMVDNANATQRQASTAVDSGDDFSHKSIQAIDNYGNFDETIMGIEASQTEEHLNPSVKL